MPLFGWVRLGWFKCIMRTDDGLMGESFVICDLVLGRRRKRSDVVFRKIITVYTTVSVPLSFYSLFLYVDSNTDTDTHTHTNKPMSYDSPLTCLGFDHELSCMIRRSASSCHGTSIAFVLLRRYSLVLISEGSSPGLSNILRFVCCRLLVIGSF